MNIDMKKLRPTVVFILFLSSCVCSSFAQSSDETELPDKLFPKELNISSSSVFELMGVTPSQISRSSDIKDFKVDWSFKSWRLNPNISLQGQPIWELFYNRKDISRYVKAPAILQKLASLDLSLGTVQDEESNRRIGFGGKINLYRSHDPLLKRGYFDSTLSDYRAEIELNRQTHQQLKNALDTLKDLSQYKTVSVQIIEVENQLNQILARQRDEILSKSRDFADQFWNSSFLDIGGAAVFTYATDSVGSLKELKVNKKTGNALWLTGGLGLGKRWMITGMIRGLQYDEKIDFVLRDTLAFTETPLGTTINQVLLTYGINIRYGSPYFNFFVEYFSDLRGISDKTKVVVEGNSQRLNELGPATVVDIKSITWNLQPAHSLTVGGDWRISRNLALNFGLRLEFDTQWKKQTFIPISTLSCLMR